MQTTTIATPYLDAALRGHTLRNFSDNFSNAPPINVWLTSSTNEIFSTLQYLEPIPKQDCANLIDQIARTNSHPDSSRIATIKTIFSYFGIEKSCEILNHIIKEDLNDFKNLLDIYTHQDEDTPKDKFFVHCLNKIIVEDIYLVEKILNFNEKVKFVLLNKLFQIINPQQLKKALSRIVVCFKNSSFKDGIELFFSISNKEIRKILFETWKADQKNKWDFYKKLIRKILIRLETTQSTDLTVLSELLCELNPFKTSSIKNLVSYLKSSCSETQLAYVLAAASNSQFLRQRDLQAALAQKYSLQPANAADLLANAFKLKDHHLFRRYSIHAFTKQIARKDIDEFFTSFLQNSNIDPLYLIYAIPKGSFFSVFQFLEEAPLNRTEIFNRMGTCGSWELRQILKDLRRARKIETIIDNSTFYLPSENEITTSGYIFNSLKKFFQSGFNSFDQIPYLQEIPPIFLAFALYDRRFRSLMLDIFYCFSPQQKEIIISQLCAAKSITNLDSLISHQNRGQKIYNKIPENILILYHTEKTEVLKRKTLEFKERFEKFKKEISSITADTFTYLNDELITLSNFFNIVQTKPYHIAFHKALDKEENQKLPLEPYEADFKTHVQIAKKLLESLKAENFGTVLTKLEDQFSLQPIEEGLPDHFVAMMTPQIQRAFDIKRNTLEQLKKVGIENKRDLILLGYEAIKDDQLQSLRNYILDCIPRTTSQTRANKCEDLWNNIYQFPSEDFFDSNMENFISRTTLLNAPPEILTRITTHLLEKMEKLIPFTNCNLNKNVISTLQNQLHTPDKDITKTFEETIKLFMKTYRAHIIPTLGRYLKQNSLNSLWNQLRTLNYPTLTSLDEMGLLGPDTPFSMQSLVNTLFPQSQHHV